MKYRLVVLTVAMLGFAALARAQQPIRLQIAAGRVTLHAQNVPVRMILMEWARLGGAKILNGDRVAGAPVTLDLDNVPERQALEILLRGVSGYMFALRAPGMPGASMYDRIMILATSAAPRNPPPAAPGPAFPNPGLVRPITQPPDQNDDDDANAGEPGTEGGGIPFPRPVAGPRGAAGINTLPLPPIGTPDDGKPQQAQPGVVSTPANPFGLPPGSSAQPGVVTPAPAPAQPANPIRNVPVN